MLRYSTLLLLTLSSVVKLQEPTPRGPPGSQETTHSDSTILPLPLGNLSFPINESLLSAPIVGRNESLLNLKERPQSPPAANQTFPQPTLALAKMVEKAKDFARKYLNATEIQQLKRIILAKRKSGANQMQLRRVVLKFLNSVLGESEKREITSRKAQLAMDFGDGAITNE